MATAAVKYFSGDREVTGIHPMRNADFAAKFGDLRGRRYDGFSKIVAHPISGPDEILPVTRVINYKRNPSLHVCDARCRCAKGGTCECSCGGQFHGIDAC